METNFIDSNEQAKTPNCVVINGVGYPFSVVTAVYPSNVRLDYKYSCNLEDVVPTIQESTTMSITYTADTTMKGKRAEIGTIVRPEIEANGGSALDNEDFMDYLTNEVKRNDGKDTAALFKKAVTYVKRIKTRLAEQEARKVEVQVSNQVAVQEAQPVMDIIKDADEVNSTTVDLIPATNDGVSVVEALSDLNVPATGPVHVQAEVTGSDLLTVEEEEALQTVTDEEIYKMNKKLNFIRTQVTNYINDRNEDNFENLTVKEYLKDLEEDETNLFESFVNTDLNTIFGFMR